MFDALALPWTWGLIAVAMIFIGAPLLRRHYRFTDNTQEANTGFFQQQKAALQQQLNDGEISQQQFDELVTEQQRLLLIDVETTQVQPAATLRGGWLLLLGLVLIPIASLQLYHYLGSQADLDITRLLEQRVNAPDIQASNKIRSELIGKIGTQLERNPEHIGYQVTQARLLTEAGEYKQAINFYRQAMSQLPDDTGIAAEYAQAAYFAENNRFTPNVEAAMDKVMAADPSNITVLGLLGIKAFSSGDYRQALINWQKVLSGLHPGSAQAQALQAGITRARQELGESLPGVEVTVHLADEFNAEPEQTVFVYAIAAGGSPMPLAIARVTAAQLPISLRLDDSMSMPGGSLLSSAEKIQLVARVSQLGNAVPSSGDFEGRSVPLSLAEAYKGVTLLIDKTID